MYNLEKEMKKFYYNEVVLPKDETTKLREKKKINIDRLKEGLKEYNKENNTEYKIAETIEQGSVAMSTVIQNDKKDYDRREYESKDSYYHDDDYKYKKHKRKKESFFGEIFDVFGGDDD